MEDNKEYYIDTNLNDLQFINTRKIKGLYFLYQNETLIYIGKSINIVFRIGQHLSDDHKMFNSFKILEVKESIQDFELLELESAFINKYKPIYNIQKNKNRIKDSKDIFEFPNVLNII